MVRSAVTATASRAVLRTGHVRSLAAAPDLNLSTHGAVVEATDPGTGV